VASLFYVFNFFVATNLLLNIGFSWTYAFLPLLIGLLIRIVTDTENNCRNIALFCMSFTLAASVASINPPNDALILIGLSSIVFYFAFIERRIKRKYLLRNLAVTGFGTSALSIWWIVPIFNTYFASSSTLLQQGIDAISWSWTHVRASFLNLFCLNGFWGWRPEYYPFYYTYTSNWILTLMLFIPFILASTALLFKDEHRKLNSYLALAVLLFIFLAKGLHEPLSPVNLFLYESVPFMNMFREPASKFTMMIIPFLALLIGYATQRIADKFKGKSVWGKMFVIVVITIFVVSSFPIIMNPMETSTKDIPYSSYVQIPQYWYDAEAWMKTEAYGYRILIVPFDDHYHVPYSWGSFGSDEFLERFFETPVISPCYSFSYTMNPNATKLLDQLRDGIAYSRNAEVKAILGLLNVKYIIQRNDLDYAFLESNNRKMLSPDRMKRFLMNQTCIAYVKSFGELDVYEYVDAQPYVHLFAGRSQYKYEIRTAREITLNPISWDFDSATDVDSWRNTTQEDQFGARCALSADGEALKFEIRNSTWGWKTITSPLIQARYGSEYSFAFDIRARNAYQVHVKVSELDTETNWIRTEYLLYLGDGSFDWKSTHVDYVPREENVAFLQFQVWSGHETPQTLPNVIWLDNVEIEGYETRLDNGIIERALSDSVSGCILDFSRVDQTRIDLVINASEPVVVTINEAYDPHWKACVDGEAINAVSVFSIMNGFQINRTGESHITIAYEPQEWFYVGLGVSAISALSLSVYLLYDFMRTHHAVTKLRAFHKQRSRIAASPVIRSDRSMLTRAVSGNVYRIVGRKNGRQSLVPNDPLP
jgi:hypothetical protein